MVRALFFDVGNTLLCPYPSVAEVCREILAAAGHPRDIACIERHMPLVERFYEDSYAADDTFWTDDARTADVWVGMYSLLAEKLEVTCDPVEVGRRVYEEFGVAGRWKPYEDVWPALYRLKECGINIGIISNWDSRLESILHDLGFRGMFEVVVSSAAVGLHKPDPRIFEYACQAMGVKPHEAAHVGDHHYADVVGARSAGLVPVWLDRSGGPHQGGAVGTLDVLEEALRLGSSRSEFFSTELGS